MEPSFALNSNVFSDRMDASFEERERFRRIAKNSGSSGNIVLPVWKGIGLTKREIHASFI